MAGLARAAASNPNAALRVAMLTDDGTRGENSPRHGAASGTWPEVAYWLTSTRPSPSRRTCPNPRLDCLRDSIISLTASSTVTNRAPLTLLRESSPTRPDE